MVSMIKSWRIFNENKDYNLNEIDDLFVDIKDLGMYAYPSCPVDSNIYEMMVSIGCLENKAFNLNDIYDTICFANSYIEEEIGLSVIGYSCNKMVKGVRFRQTLDDYIESEQVETNDIYELLDICEEKEKDIIYIDIFYK